MLSTMSDSSYPKVIYPESFDEQAEFEMPFRGYLSSVLVEAEDGCRYPVYFVDPTRLQQDLTESVKLGEPFFAEPGLIVLPEVTVAAIEDAVKILWEQGFFAHLKPSNQDRSSSTQRS